MVAEPNLETLGLAKPVLVKLETFDSFQYTLKVGTKTNDTYPVMVSVSASLPKERAPGKDEKPEDKAKLDKEFRDRQKVLTDKLAQEKSLENWVYLVSSWSLDSVLKNRSQLMVEKKDEAKTNAAPAEPSEAEDLVPEIK